MTTISLLAALDRHFAIGKDGDLPWHLPDDLKRFKAITLGKPLLMGRRTAESLRRALPGRRNLVLTRSGRAPFPGMEAFGSLEAALAAVAREEYAARRERERFLDSSLLREPAWDMLLDLFIHRVGGKRITLTSAAIASKVPYGTAHRHLEHLEALGLVRRTPSETDARVQFLDLSDDGFRRIGSWLRNRLQSRLA